MTRYIYDQAGHVLAQYDGVSGSLEREYIWLGDKPIAVIDAGTTPTTYYVHTDHLNRPIAMTDASRAFVARYTYDAFGNVYAQTGSKAIDLRFPGQVFQAESGLAYNWHRTYDATTGSYTQPDPLGLASGAFAQVDAVNDNGGSLPAGFAAPASGTDLASLALGGIVPPGPLVQPSLAGLRDPVAPWFQPDGNLTTSRYAYANNDRCRRRIRAGSWAKAGQATSRTRCSRMRAGRLVSTISTYGVKCTTLSRTKGR